MPETTTQSAQGSFLTLPSSQVVEPFGKINYRQEADGRLWVRAYILMERAIEGAHTGIALDGSGTMRALFGGRRPEEPNRVSPFAQNMSSYLARKLDSRGLTSVIYWALGADGKGVEDLGTFSADEAERFTFGGPKDYGLHTCLLPAIQHFIHSVNSSHWGFFVFVTDGRLEDLADVKAYTRQLAQEIQDGKRAPLKLIIVGMGAGIDRLQLEELDNLDTGTNVDLWDHKIADDMQQLAEIFTELVDERVIVAQQGRILDSNGVIVKDYRDTGVPALMEFFLPPGSTGFILEIEKAQVAQKIL